MPNGEATGEAAIKPCNERCIVRVDIEDDGKMFVTHNGFEGEGLSLDLATYVNEHEKLNAVMKAWLVRLHAEEATPHE